MMGSVVDVISLGVLTGFGWAMLGRVASLSIPFRVSNNSNAPPPASNSVPMKPEKILGMIFGKRQAGAGQL
jgi:hypothetical protein